MKPFVTACDDYHDFKEVAYHFQNAGVNLDYEEIGCFTSDITDKPHNRYGYYHAVFWPKGKKGHYSEQIKKLKKDFKKYEEDYDESNR